MSNEEDSGSERSNSLSHQSNLERSPSSDSNQIDNWNQEDVDENPIENLAISFDKLISSSKDTEVIEGRFNVFTYFQQKCFKPETYNPKDEKWVIKNNDNSEEVKQVPLCNFMRWRYDKENKIESNSKLIEWSDGTFSLCIGSQYFDVMFSEMYNTRNGVKVNNDISIVNEEIKKRMFLTQTEESVGVRESQEEKAKVKLSFSYYDKQRYNKDEFSSRYPRAKNSNKEPKEPKNPGSGNDGRNWTRKRNRNDS